MAKKSATGAPTGNVSTEGNLPSTNERKKRAPVAYVDNAHRFKVLGKKRLNKALKVISLIGNLSGSGYQFTEEQVAKIKSELHKAVDSAMARFDRAAKKTTEVEL
jgi:phage repressor protein C with HTH and peptisase S24 domain